MMILYHSNSELYVDNFISLNFITVGNVINENSLFMPATPSTDHKTLVTANHNGLLISGHHNETQV